MIVFISAIILIIITVIIMEVEHSREMKKLYKEYVRITKEDELTDKEKFAILHKLTDKLDLKE